MEACLFHQLSNYNMQGGIQDGSQNIKTVFHVFYACINCAILHFFGNLHNNIHVIHLCIMSVQSNFGHNPFSAKSLAVLATCIIINMSSICVSCQSSLILAIIHSVLRA